MRADLTAFYQDVHRHPELGFDEHRTAGKVADRLRELGFEVITGLGGTGVAGVYGNGDGPTVLLRADMDALPIEEDTGLPYASRATGTDPQTGERTSVMHACGHDMHVTCLLGALQLLARDKGKWSGTLVAVFHPAEELGTGARAMVADGLFDRVPRPDVALAQHVAPVPAGTVVLHEGAALSNADSFRITLYGHGGHGSTPNTTVDPIVMAASVVMRLQTVVSRTISPTDTAVVTVGAVRAGKKDNIIPDRAELLINVRTLTTAVRTKTLETIRRIVHAEAQASAAPRLPEITEISSYDAQINDPDATEKVAAAFRRRFGDVRVVRGPQAMPSEDFGELPKAAGSPSVYWFVGSADPAVYRQAEAKGTVEVDVPMNHSPAFAPVVEPTLTTGVHALVAAALAWLGR
ncbi:amidohydrolase [Nonomuraea sp. NN258]|nr:amidohydrolase [Nonomuraea antri]